MLHFIAFVCLFFVRVYVCVCKVWLNIKVNFSFLISSTVFFLLLISSGSSNVNSLICIVLVWYTPKKMFTPTIKTIINYFMYSAHAHHFITLFFINVLMFVWFCSLLVIYFRSVINHNYHIWGANECSHYWIFVQFGCQSMSVFIFFVIMICWEYETHTFSVSSSLCFFSVQHERKVTVFFPSSLDLNTLWIFVRLFILVFSRSVQRINIKKISNV